MSEQELSRTSAFPPGEDYEKVNVATLGVGGQGSVKLVRRKSDGMFLARKKIRSSSPPEREREILQKLKHPNIIGFYGCDFHVQRKCLFLYMEYCPLLDLSEFFKERINAVNDYYLWQILAQLSAALVYCHHGIGLKDGYFVAEEAFEAVIHRDIKPSNVLVSSWGDGRIKVKLCDFGISRKFSTSNEGSYVGTRKYREPESINGWAFKSDVYSLGCTMRALVELSKSFVPSKSLEEVISKCEEKNRSQRICSVRLLDSIPKKHRDALGRFSFQIGTSNSSLTEPHSYSFASGVIAMVANIDPIETIRLKRLYEDLGDDFRIEACTTALNIAIQHQGYHSKAVPRILTLPDFIAGFTMEKKRLLLHLAAKFGHATMVQVMVAHGASVDARGKYGETPLHLAAFFGNPEAVWKLAKLGATIDSKNKSGETPLHLAASSGHLEAVGQLVELGAAINSRNKNGETPLHLAASSGHLETVEKLVDLGAAINLRNKYGQTPLQRAVYSTHLETVEKLVNLGAAINSGNKNGRTSLHWAALNGDLETIERLVELGAAVDAKGYDGKTPLHFAALCGELEAVEKLVELGAAVDTRDKDGRCPGHVAADQGYMQIAIILKFQKVPRCRERVGLSGILKNTARKLCFSQEG